MAMRRLGDPTRTKRWASLTVGTFTLRNISKRGRKRFIYAYIYMDRAGLLSESADGFSLCGACHHGGHCIAVRSSTGDIVYGKSVLVLANN